MSLISILQKLNKVALTISNNFGHRIYQRNKITAGTVPDMLPRVSYKGVSKRSRIVCTNETENIIEKEFQVTKDKSNPKNDTNNKCHP